MSNELHRVKLWRLAFPGSTPPRVAYIRSPQHMGDELRRAAFFIHGIEAVRHHGLPFSELMRRATSEHTARTVYQCEDNTGRRAAVPVELTDEDADPIDVASLI